ncbi:MAG TPA: hypothetical protein VG965_03100 [Patescibacteria group bacterium]|nr:hypothetical protein [Patescibacteria group bacterium]
MESDEVVDILKKCGVILRDHFDILMEHTDMALDWAGLSAYPQYTRALASAFKERLQGHEIDTVFAFSPEFATLGYEVALGLSYGTRQTNLVVGHVIDVGYPNGRVVVDETQKDYLRGRIALIGGIYPDAMVQKADVPVSNNGGTIASVGYLLNAEPLPAVSDVRIFSLAQVDVKKYPDTDCEICQAGMPIRRQYPTAIRRGGFAIVHGR